MSVYVWKCEIILVIPFWNELRHSSSPRLNVSAIVRLVPHVNIASGIGSYLVSMVHMTMNIFQSTEYELMSLSECFHGMQGN